MDIDIAKKNFERIFAEVSSYASTIITEQDTRLKIVNELIIHVLGWNKDEIRTEMHVNPGYADYIFTVSNRNRFVVEAKKVSSNLIDSKLRNKIHYKANSVALKSAQEGLDQVASYCVKTGVQFAALTNGMQWIGFWASRDDGIPPQEGAVMVFPDMDAINEEFALFYDLFSKEGVLNNLYKIRIREKEGLVVTHEVIFKAPLEESKIRLIPKSQFSSDLERIFAKFFSSISNENDIDMLSKCFVPSKESYEADSSLQKIATNLVSTIAPVDTDEASGLQEEIRHATEGIARAKKMRVGEFVLIVGNKGSGKSTFIQRFFSLILDKNIKNCCLVIKVDLADSSGELISIVNWLNIKIIKLIENEIFSAGKPKYEELQGIFYDEYSAWKDGEHKYLYSRDKLTFKEKFGEFVHNFRENRKDEYLIKLLSHCVAGRQRMPCIVFDNTDHFPQTFQENVFQYAQSIFRAVFSFIICPITDRTIWQLSKSGPLQSYPVKSFYLPTPPIKEVLIRRVNFIKDVLINRTRKDQAEYLLQKGIRLNIQDINAFTVCIEEVLIKTDYISRIIGGLANHDIRRILELSRQVISSPQIGLEELVKLYITKKDRVNIDQNKVLRAILYGQYNMFRQSDSSFILNIFSIQPKFLTSPLIKISIIQLLIDIDSKNDDLEYKYLEIQSIQDYFESMSISREIVKFYIHALLKYRLIEPYDPTDIEIYENQRVKVTWSGKIHLEFSLSQFIYLTTVARVTPIEDIQVLNFIKNELDSRKLLFENWKSIVVYFVKYCLDQDKLFVNLPEDENYKGQTMLRKTLSEKWMQGMGVNPINQPVENVI